jgi:hypothetical protein
LPQPNQQPKTTCLDGFIIAKKPTLPPTPPPTPPSPHRGALQLGQMTYFFLEMEDKLNLLENGR